MVFLLQHAQPHDLVLRNILRLQSIKTYRIVTEAAVLVPRVVGGATAFSGGCVGSPSSSPPLPGSLPPVCHPRALVQRCPWVLSPLSLLCERVWAQSLPFLSLFFATAPSARNLPVPLGFLPGTLLSSCLDAPSFLVRLLQLPTPMGLLSPQPRHSNYQECPHSSASVTTHDPWLTLSALPFSTASLMCPVNWCTVSASSHW